MKTEAEIGLMQLQAEESQGWSAAIRSQEMQGRILP